MQWLDLPRNSHLEKRMSNPANGMQRNKRPCPEWVIVSMESWYTPWTFAAEPTRSNKGHPYAHRPLINCELMHTGLAPKRTQYVVLLRHGMKSYRHGLALGSQIQGSKSILHRRFLHNHYLPCGVLKLYVYAHSPRPTTAGPRTERQDT